MTFSDHIRRAIADLRDRGIFRSPRTVDGRQGPVLQVDGRSVIGLCSNNYLGLADHPVLMDAFRASLDASGLGAGASRHISGSSAVHVAAEGRLASFLRMPSALMFSSGYAANVGAIQALVGPGDLVLSDELNHASIIDGCRLSRARVVVYPHKDHAALGELLADHRPRAGATLVITESLFSMDGDIAPLREIAALCARHQAGLMVDEAHALGVFGPQGRGLCHAASVVPDVLVGTLGKAFGLSGAFVAGGEDAVRLIQNKARSFVFSTATLPALAAAAIAAVDLVEAADEARTRLSSHARRLRSNLQEFGYRVPAGETPIIPIFIGKSSPVMALSQELLGRGVFVHGIRAPTVAEGSSRLRVTPMATHTTEHIDFVINSFRELRDMYQGIIRDT